MRDRFENFRKDKHFSPDPVAWDLATSFVRSRMLAYTSGSRVTDIDCLTIRDKSSPGFPYRKLFNSKKEMWADPVGRSLLLYEIERGKQGPVVHYWTPSLKDEPKSSYKKNRLFLIENAPLNAMHSLVSKDFNTRLYRKNYISVGMPLNHNGWTQSLDQLPAYVSNGDGVQYDSSHSKEILSFVAQLRLDSMNFKNSEERMLFNNVRRNVIYKYVVGPFGELIAQGNPSGQFDTTMDNSIITEFSVAYSWYREFPYNRPYYRYVGARVTGDDVNFGLFDESLRTTRGVYGGSWQKSFERSFAELGFDYSFGEWQDKRDVSFLSHTTRDWCGLSVPSLSTKRLAAHSAFVRRGTFESQIQSLYGVLEASIFNDKSRQLYDRLNRYVILPSYESIRNKRAHLETASCKETTVLKFTSRL